MVLMLLSLPGFGADKSANSKKNSTGLEVLVSADAIDSTDGFRPKPGKPIYYIFQQTRLSMGEPVGNTKLPKSAIVERAVVAELQKQGFIRTEVGGPVPSLFVMAIVGDSNFAEPPLDDLVFYLPVVNRRKVAAENGVFPASSFDAEQFQELVEKEAMRIRYLMSPRLADKEKIEAFLGAEKVKYAVKNGAMELSAAARVAQAAYEDRLYVSLNAFDAAKWTKKEKVLLWRVNMSIDWRNDLTVVLPKILADAGPLFGTDVNVPTFIDDRDRQRKAGVEIGDTEVVPEAMTRGKAAGKRD